MDFLNPVENPGGFTAFIIGISVLSIIASFLFRAKWSSGLTTGGMKGGKPGTAVITGMGQTGTFINNLPVLTFELMVQLPGMAPYAAAAKQSVPHMAFGMLAPGRTVAVVVSPKNPAKVKLDLQGTANLAAVASMPGMAPAGMAPGMAGGGAPSPQVTSNAELLARGTRSWVTVMSVQDTGQLYGSDPVCLLGLHVHAADGEYGTSANGYRIPADVRSRIVAGKQLQGAFDPANRQSVALDWATA
ncbi:MAG: hypothetical protein M3527_10650 [Actinomycetota bacterium]|nr:hypothetical protein [Acidimicrobiia bacterium]MDQ3294888.1 hypothetical protein [Actinomycetota bacterium]